MSQKVLLVLFDGARPDAFEQCGHKFYEKLKKESSYSLTTQTVMPSITLPCHFSLFASCDARIHTITSNCFKQPDKWVETIFEQVGKAGKKAAAFYNWGELKDLWQPGSLIQSGYFSGYKMDMQVSNKLSMEAAKDCIANIAPDFVFLYFEMPDEYGHCYGWMGEKYMYAINYCFDLTEEIYNSLPDDYTLIITADHGGHDNDHGTEMPEDMTIPLFINGRDFRAGRVFEDTTIKDIAPTVTDLLEVDSYKMWQGKSLLEK